MVAGAKTDSTLMTQEALAPKIHVIRNERRFPSDFSFMLTPKEFVDLIFQIGNIKTSRRAAQIATGFPPTEKPRRRIRFHIKENNN